MRTSKKKTQSKHKYSRQRGAVSIFLIIILVPCIALSSICVDLSRVQMSKATAVSSADLALNTLLTNYDADLSDWYGMVGSCQTIEEFYKISAGYFLRAISSQGLGDDEILLLADVYSSVTEDDSIYDLLQVEATKEVKVQEVNGANLSNATLIKDQIVEFMKYRAPIELTTTIIERLKNDNSFTAAKEATKNETLVDTKQTFYETEGELLAGAFRSYKAVKKYIDKVEDPKVKLTNEKLADYAEKINACREAYLKIHNISVSNLFNTKGLTVYNRKVINIGQYWSYDMDRMGHIYSSEETLEDSDETVYYLNGSDFSKQIKKIRENITKFNDAKTNYETAVASLMSNPPGNNDVNAIQWWVQMDKAIYDTSGNLHQKLSSAADSMMEGIRTLSVMQECMQEPNTKDVLPSDWWSQCSQLSSELQSLHDMYLDSYPDTNSAYVRAAKKLDEVSHANSKNIRSSQVTVNIDGSNVTVDTAIKNTGKELKDIWLELNAVKELLDTAIDGDGKKIPSLSSLADLAEQYNKDLTKYQNTANSTDTEMGKAEPGKIQEEIDKGNIEKDITRDSVTKLKTRLTNIRSQLTTLMKAIDSLEYGGTQIKNITTFDQFQKAAHTVVSDSKIPLRNSDIKTYAETTTFPKLFKPSGTAVTLKNTTGNTHNPQLSLTAPESTDTPKLMTYLHGKFKDRTEKELDEQEAEQKKGEEAKDAAEQKAKNKGRYHGGGSNVAKAYSDGTEIGFDDGLFGSVMELLGMLQDPSKITSIRDDLYVTSYIMSMFSYATFETEGLYNLVEKKTELKLPTGVDYQPAEYADYMGAADQEKTWLSTNVKDTHNKTLTNKMINTTNNVAYCGEVEYILKGGTNDANVKAVYGDIYAIRYSLNLVSSFQHFWTLNTQNGISVAVNTIANAIQAATSGIIPAPVTKIILLPILTAFETGSDMDRLEAGFPVEMYKMEYTDWWYSINGQFKSITDFLDNLGPGNKTNPDKGIYYSDYLTVFVYLGLKSEQKAQMYYRIADVIQGNMRQATKDSDYSMAKVRMYFSLDATLRVKPLMVTLPYYFDDYNNLMATTTDWCTYKVNVVRGYS